MGLFPRWDRAEFEKELTETIKPDGKTWLEHRIGTVATLLMDAILLFLNVLSTLALVLTLSVMMVGGILNRESPPFLFSLSQLCLALAATTSALRIVYAGIGGLRDRAIDHWVDSKFYLRVFGNYGYTVARFVMILVGLILAWIGVHLFTVFFREFS